MNNRTLDDYQDAAKSTERTPCFIFDIDGTIADGSHRIHHIQRTDGGPKDWPAYFAACGSDEPIRHILLVAYALNSAGHKIVLVSGRSAVVVKETEEWLRWWLPIYDLLLMRPVDDHRDDDVLKIEMLGQIRAAGYEPIMAFDDRTRVVNAWRAAGVPCAQVAPGDF